MVTHLTTSLHHEVECSSVVHPPPPPPPQTPGIPLSIPLANWESKTKCFNMIVVEPGLLLILIIFLFCKWWAVKWNETLSKVLSDLYFIIKAYCRFIWMSALCLNYVCVHDNELGISGCIECLLWANCKKKYEQNCSVCWWVWLYLQSIRAHSLDQVSFKCICYLV